MKSGCNIEVNRQQDYYVYGYDKDADVYEQLCASFLYERAKEIGRAIMRYHMEVEEICRTKTGEPFDWFVVTDNMHNPLHVFTADDPDGYAFAGKYPDGQKCEA